MRDQGAHSNCPQPKVRDISTSKSKSPKRIIKQFYAHGSIKMLNISDSTESMDIKTDKIIVNLNLIKEKCCTWNHFTVCKQMSSDSF